MRVTGLRTIGLIAVAISLAAQEAPKAAERAYAFKTTNGYYLTAENGGGGSVNTDRTELGPWETFILVQTAPGVFAFRTENGHYLGDMVNERRVRQGRGGLMASRSNIDSSTQFKLMILNPEGPVVALVTASGKYVTAENSGGVKARGARAMATDRTEIGEWEMFTMIDVEKEKASKSGN